MKNIRSFLLTLTFTTIATTASLYAMEPQCMDVDISSRYRQVNSLIDNLVNDIVQNRNNPFIFVNAIEQFCKTCSPDLSPEVLVEIALYMADVSLCDIKSDTGCTSLHKAAYDGHTEVVRILLTAARDKVWDLICMKNNNGWTALHYAACNGRTEVVNVLLAAARGNAWVLICMGDEHNWTALHYAACYGHTEFVNVLLAAADKLKPGKAWELICIKEKYRQTALHYATCFRRTEIVNILLAAAGDKAWELICMGDNNNKTALDFANNEIKQIMEQYRPGNQ